MLRLMINLRFWGFDAGAPPPANAVTVRARVDVHPLATVLRASDARAAGIRCIKGRSVPFERAGVTVNARVGLAWMRPRGRREARPVAVLVVPDRVLDATGVRAVTGDEVLYVAAFEARAIARASAVSSGRPRRIARRYGGRPRRTARRHG